MGTIEVRTSVTLRIVADDLDPDAVTADLGIPPDHAHRKGEIFGGRTPGVRKHGRWMLDSSAHLPRTDDANAHLLWLVEKAAPRVERLNAYKKDGCTVDVWVAMHTDADHGGPTLQAETLARLGSLGLEVHLDLGPAEKE